MNVSTIFGLVPREYLEVKDIIEEHTNSRTVATEWRLTQDLVLDGKLVEFTFDDGRVVRSTKGELARRDVACSILAPVGMGGEQGQIG